MIPTLKLVAITILIVFTSSCSTTKHVKKKDGPPHFYVDESKIPNAKPKAEPLAKYGNMPYYYVFGKRYYTMKSSRHYHAVGTASWYGTSFHSRKTSSGEPYDMLAMTAAHKSLPLPTYVEVTNLKNRRKVIVKVNDRGPFVSDRLIDLSYVAAKKLDMLGHGTTRVSIRAINPYSFGRRIQLAEHRHIIGSHAMAKKTQLASHTRPELTVTESLYLQVGAFRSKQHAERLKKRLVSVLTTPIQIATATPPDQLYRVRVGPIVDARTADILTRRLKGMRIESNKITSNDIRCTSLNC